MPTEKPAGAIVADKFTAVLIFVREARGWRRAITMFAAGAGAALAMAPFYLLPLLVAGFSALVLSLDGAAKVERPRRAALFAGWCFGLGFFLVGIYWMVLSFFVQADQFAWMAPLALFGIVGFLALFPATACALAIQFWRPGWSRIFVFTAAFMLLEYLRGHILTGLPWNLPGQALAGSAIGAQSAAWIGVYGLSLIVVFLSAAPVALLARDARQSGRYNGVVVTLIGVVALFVFGAIRLAAADANPKADVHLRIVQASIPQREKIDPALWSRNIDRHITLSTGEVDAGKQVVVIWPENAAAMIDESPGALSAVDQRLPKGSILVTGAVRREAGDAHDRYFNSIAVIAPTETGRKAHAFYDKHHLVPFGEYLPLRELLKAIGLAQLAPYEEGFAAGSGPAVLSLPGGKVAPFICYEAIFPGVLYPRGERPDWLLTVTNDAWFGNSSGPRQHLDQARLRSIETGLPMARAANTGVSAVIDAKGRVLERLELYQTGRIDTVLPGAGPPTLYSMIGDILFFIMLFTVGCLGLYRRSK